MVEAHQLNTDSQPSYDDRTVALSYGSRCIFGNMGLWSSLEPVAEAIDSIHISDRGHFGVTCLTKEQEGVEALGYVLENRSIGQQLYAAMSANIKDTQKDKAVSNISLFCPAELTALKQAIEKIEPDQVQLNTLDRPGPVSTLRAATRQELERVLDFWQLENVSIIADVPERKDLLAYRKDTESAILGTIARRPCTLKDLSKILGLKINEGNKYLDVLEADRKIKVVKQKRGFFYQLNG